MKLLEEDCLRFYNIWFNLLDYTNTKYKVTPNIKDLAHSTGINAEDISPLRDRLWMDNVILDEIVATNPFQFSEADISIVNSWRNRVSGKFILLKHLKNYSILLSNDNIYGVIGIVSPFAEMFPSFVLPLMVEAVLLPFEGKIIYDSLLTKYPVSFGGGAKKGFQEEYRELKSKLGIVTFLDNTES